jgi:hypothetical protein
MDQIRRAKGRAGVTGLESLGTAWVSATYSYHADSSSTSIISFLAMVLFNPCSCPVHYDLFATPCLFSQQPKPVGCQFQLRTAQQGGSCHVQGVNLLFVGWFCFAARCLGACSCPGIVSCTGEFVRQERLNLPFPGAVA